MDQQNLGNTGAEKLEHIVDFYRCDITEFALLLRTDEAPLAKLPDRTKHALSRIKLVSKVNP